MEAFGLRIILLTIVIAVLVLSLIGGRKVLSKAEGPGGNALFVYELFKIADAEYLGPLFFPVTGEMDWSQDKKGGDIK